MVTFDENVENFSSSVSLRYVLSFLTSDIVSIRCLLLPGITCWTHHTHPGIRIIHLWPSRLRRLQIHIYVGGYASAYAGLDRALHKIYNKEY